MKWLKILKEQYMPYVKKPKHDTAFMIDFLTSKCDCTPQANDFMGEFFLIVCSTMSTIVFSINYRLMTGKIFLSNVLR